MRLAHKRKVQQKLNKWVKTTKAAAPKAAVKAAPKAAKPAKVESSDKPAPAPKASVATSEIKVSLTPKQQQVLDIVVANPEGINPKGIGLEAGQEDAKAASWATGALKKLVEEELVVRHQQTGNKVVYTAK